MNKNFLIIISLLYSFACSSEEAKNVSYSENVQPILNDHCVDCHNGQTKIDGLNFENYGSLMSSRYLNRTTPLAVAGDAASSRLFIVVHSDNPAVRMPPENYGYDKLNDNEINIIRVWINEGAENN